MAIDRDRKYREMVMRGKYSKLYTHLSSRPAQLWNTTFREIESVLGFELPASARLHRPWWANQRVGNGHSQALAWSIAGWETADVDMEAETLSFKPGHTPEALPTFNLDEVWPVHSAGGWPEGLSLRREDMYEDRV
ncbi:MAG: hypothetical protein J4F40_19055 [Alphaproteobacteria bacterium]|nr:hypothetical protein [Alphaproteobacteria bacterium]